MKKRIGSKFYDTDNGIPVLPDQHLYKQPNKRTFYLFDGVTITPLNFDQAAEMIRQAGDPDLLQYIGVKPSKRGCLTITIDADHYVRVSEYSRRTGVSMKSLIEGFIDSLPKA